MTDLQLDWATDLAILELSGSTVERRVDHLLVRTPQNPEYHWGNCLLVTDAAAIDDAQRWLARFSEEFPHADWVAIGLPSMPRDAHAWLSQGLELDQLDVLATHERPRTAPLAEGYTVRELSGDDWEQLTQHRLAENAASGEHSPEGYERFMRATVAARQQLCDEGHAAWFGAFSGDELVADLGIVRCGTIGRYQDVATVEAHRRRGPRVAPAGGGRGVVGASRLRRVGDRDRVDERRRPGVPPRRVRARCSIGERVPEVTPCPLTRLTTGRPSASLSTATRSTSTA